MLAFQKFRKILTKQPVKIVDLDSSSEIFKFKIFEGFFCFLKNINLSKNNAIPTAVVNNLV